MGSRDPGRVTLLVAMVVAIAAAAVAIFASGEHQPAEADGTGASMALRVSADTAKSQLVCDTGSVHRTCEIIGENPFSIDVLADTQPTTGFTAYQAVVQFSSLLSLQQQIGTSENVWPACNPSFASEDKSVPNRYRIQCGSGTTGNILYTGPLVNLHFTCPAQGGSAQVDLIGGAGTAVSKYVRSGTPSIVFLKSVDKSGTDVADAVLINCLPDLDGDGMPDVFEKAHSCLDQSVRDANEDGDGDGLSNLNESGLGTDPCAFDTDGDGLGDGEEIAGVTGAKSALGQFVTDPLDPDTDDDGCTDGAELGADEKTGGRRDPLNRWDFYDINGDRTVDVPNDILQVLLRFSANPSVPYAPIYDRGSAVGPNVWNRNGPDGTIDVPNDILPAIFQFLHDCR